MKKYLIVTKYVDKTTCTDLKNILDHQNTLNSVIETLKHKKCKFKIIPVNKIKLSLINKYDGVITVGGDGTVLHVAKYMISKNMPFFTINSQPNISIGHLTKFNISTFMKTFLAQEKFETTTVYPLKVIINSKHVKYFSNDLLFSNINPASMSHYSFEIYSDLMRFSEIQKSSGLWISTELGSTAAIKSAGFKSTLPANNISNTSFNSNIILYKVREPYELKQKYEHTEGAIIDKCIILRPHIPGMCLWFDGSYDKYNLAIDDTVVISGETGWDISYTLVVPDSKNQD